MSDPSQPDDARRRAEEIVKRCSHTGYFVLKSDPHREEPIQTSCVDCVADAVAQAVKDERANQQSMIDAYKVHHDKFHESCQIDGPPIPPKALRR